MKLRRAVVTAAAAAVIAPLALLSAPAALAAESSSPSPSSTESTSSVTPSATDTTGASTATSSSSSEPLTASSSQSQTSTGTATSTSTQTSTSSATSSATETAPEEVDYCAEEDAESLGLSDDLHSGLSGLPDSVVAGSGWTDFSFDVSNTGDQEIKNIKPLIGVAAIGWDAEDYSGDIKVQVFQKDSGTWVTLADAAGEGATFTPFTLGAGKSTSFKLRLSVSGDVPDAMGITGGFAQYSDAEGCWIADDPNGWLYLFDILAAGSDAGDPNDAKPQTGGSSDLSDVSTVDATGSLASTGSSSALPIIGLVGGVAVVAGAGAVVVARRRKDGSHA